MRIKLPQFSRIFRIRIANAAEIDIAVQALSRIPGVAYAEKNMDAQLANDPTYGNQWHLNNTGQSGGTPGADIKAEQAWQIFTGSSSIKIGIFDNGVELSHDEFAGKISGDNIDAFGSDPYWSHGTHVAGIAAAKANNGYGGRGVDWNAQILSKRIFDGSGFYLGNATVSNAVISAVDAGTHVLNHSWRSTTYSITVHQAFAYAYKMNRVSVAAMGNDYSSSTFYPAGFGQGIIAVGATQDNDQRSSWSNTGNHIDVVAPGGSNTWSTRDQRDIWSSWRNNSYEWAPGTSMATPQVSGISSLLKGYNTNLYNDDIEKIIQLSADKVRQDLYVYDANGWNIEMGYGRINARRALDLLRSPYVLAHHTVSGGTSVGYYFWEGFRFFGVSGLDDGYLYNVEQHLVHKTVSLPGYSEQKVWGRGVASIGFNDREPNYGMGFCEVVPGSQTQTSVTLRTWVYKVFRQDGKLVGWYPTDPSNVQFAYTVHGIPGSGKLADGSSLQLKSQDATQPLEFDLQQNHPNPFNPETEINFALPEPSSVRLSVLDVLGREIAILEDRTLPAGYQKVRWNGKNAKGESVSSGVYFYRISTVGESGNTFTQTMKMLLAK